MAFSPEGQAGSFWFKAAVLLLLPFGAAALSAACMELPWIYTVILNICLLLAGLVLLKPSVGLNILLFTVPVTSFICYAAVKAKWNFITGINYIDAFSVSMPLILLTSLAVVLHKWGGITETSLRNPLTFPVLVLIVYAGATVLWSASWQHSLFQFFILLTNILLFRLIVSLLKDAAMLRKALWFWSLSISLQAVSALTDFFFDSFLKSTEVLPGLVAGFHFFASFLQPSGWPQVASGLQDHHETSLMMNLACATVLALILTSTSLSRKVLLAVMLFLLVFVTLRTESRAGFGALLIVGCALFLLLKQLRNKLIRLLLVFALLIITVYTAQNIVLSLIIQKDFTPRLFSLGFKVIESGDAIDPEIENKEHSRKRLWQKSFRKYSEVPVQGLGVGNLKKLMNAPHAHSIYFSLWFDFGVVGLFFLAWLAFYLLKGIIPALLRQETPSEIIASALSGGLLAICIQGLVDFEYNTTSIWVYLALMTAALNLIGIKRQAIVERN